MTTSHAFIKDSPFKKKLAIASFSTRETVASALFIILAGCQSMFRCYAIANDKP